MEELKQVVTPAVDSAVPITPPATSGARPLWEGGPPTTPEQIVSYAKDGCEFCRGRGFVNGRRLNARTRAMEKINEVCQCAIDRFKKAYKAPPDSLELPTGTAEEDAQIDDDIEQDSPPGIGISLREKYQDLIKRADIELVAALERQNIKEGPFRHEFEDAKVAHKAEVDRHEASELAVLKLETKAVELFRDAESMMETVSRIKKEAQATSAAAATKRSALAAAGNAPLEAARRHVEQCERALEKMTKAERPEIRKLTKQIERWTKKLERMNGDSR